MTQGEMDFKYLPHGEPMPDGWEIASDLQDTHHGHHAVLIKKDRMAVHFSSNSDLWATPQAFFDSYDIAYGFTLDVCALPDNAKCSRYFSPEQDGLKQVWEGICWMNPPYGREIGKWVRKAYEASLAGATVVCLLPARTDTAWWHDYCQKGQIEFIRGRLKFNGHKNSAPFPSAVVVFRPTK